MITFLITSVDWCCVTYHKRRTARRDGNGPRVCGSDQPALSPAPAASRICRLLGLRAPPRLRDGHLASATAASRDHHWVSADSACVV
jgi:hypothetical protein